MTGFSIQGVIATNSVIDARRPGLWTHEEGGTPRLTVEGQGGQSVSTYTLSNGTLTHEATSALSSDLIGWVAAGRSWAVRAETLDRLTPEGQKVYLNDQGQPGLSATMLPLDLDGGRVYVTALPEEAGVYTLRPDDGALTQAHVRSDSNSTYAAGPTAMTALNIDGTPHVAVASGGAESGLTLYQVSSTGALTARSSLGAEEGVGISDPTALRTVEVAGESLIIMGAAGSGTLSVFAVSNSGALTLQSHTLDTLNTRFGGITALDTAQVAGQTYLVAGGADDGLSLFLVLPGGQLAHLDTIADGTGTALANVSAIELLAEESTLHVFATAQAELGLTHLSVEFPLSQQVITGSDAAETLTGGAGDDVLFDGAGADRLSGAAGADVFVFTLDGETDRITDFEPGQDMVDLSGWGRLYTLDQLTITGRSDGAQITFGNEDLILQTADGQALTLQDFAQTDMLGLPLGPQTQPLAPVQASDPAHDAANTLMGTDEADTLVGGGGDDTINGAPGADLLEGDSGNDILIGGTGSDDLRGGTGNDRLEGGSAHDVLRGGDGHDTLIGGTGADTLFGGEGDDILESESAFDVLHGGGGHDRLTGGIGADLLYGDAGNDTLLGNTGVDTLFGGDGDDWMSAGNGADEASGGAGNDFLIGRTGWDTLYGNEGDDSLYGSNGKDRLFAGDGNDFVSGGYGWDYIEGGTGNDSLYGNIGADTLIGEAGHDLLSGATGDDWLYGGDGNDTLYGNQGIDRIDGGAGDDLLRGGTLRDTFIFKPGFGADTITDFEDFQDILAIDRTLTSATDAQGLLSSQGRTVDQGVELDFGGGNTILLEGITDLSALTDNIVFL